MVGKLRYLFHQIPAVLRRKPKTVTTLSAVITVGNDESAAIWSERLGRKVVAGEKIDLGVISQTEGAGWSVSNG